MTNSTAQKNKEIDWDLRFKSICNFCRNYNQSPALKTGSPESNIINSRLEAIAKYLYNDLDTSAFDYSFSKGHGFVPKSPWVAINIKGKRVSTSISFVICFARSGDGIVLGLMSPSSFKSTVNTVIRTKNEGVLLLDYKDTKKYDDKFINPLEIYFDDISIKKINNHKNSSCMKLLEINKNLI